MSENLFDDATVEVHDHGHREDIAASEDAGHEQFRVERVREIVKRA